MLLAACFGSVGKMQTMDTICNHGGNYVDVLLRQFGVGVQKPGKTVHYKNQDGTDIFILGRLDIVTFDFFQNGIPQMLRKAVHRGYRNHTEVIRCLLEQQTFPAQRPPVHPAAAVRRAYCRRRAGLSAAPFRR